MVRFMKKTVISFLLLLITSMILTMSPEAKGISFDASVSTMAYSTTTDYNRDDDFTGNCADFARTIRMGGYLIFLVKIILPFIIIVKASMNLFSLVTNGSPEEFKKQTMSFAYSCAAAIIIFFVPTIVDTLFGFVNKYSTGKNADTEICVACVFDPFSDTCKNAAD